MRTTPRTVGTIITAQTASIIPAVINTRVADLYQGTVPIQRCLICCSCF